MKKFTFKNVLDGFRSSVVQPSRQDQGIQETLRSEHFQIKRTFRHGFPYQPTSVAFDPIQRLLAIGSKCGSLRILGRAGVDVQMLHEGDGLPGSLAVLHLQFLVNEGALISATADDTLHLWNFRQKNPQVVQSLKFQREKITCIHLPLQSKWLYVGTEKGNIHIVHIESFELSGYVINWNKTIEMTRKTHPGSVVHLSDNPLDPNKLLIAYESGLVAVWDLRKKVIELRYQTVEGLRSVVWHHEGRQFMCSHTDGTLSTWSLKQTTKAMQISQPHAKLNKDGKPEVCKPIFKVEWKASKSGDSFIIFSGGMPNDQAGRTPSITVIHSKTTTVLEMEHSVIDFITLCDSPYVSEQQEPYAIVALLQNDLVVMDLQTAGFPCLENPYPMDIHESPVTCCSYLADCPGDLIPAFYSVGRASSTKKSDFSEKEWPISGGEWSTQSCSYSEIIMTGHADGSIKFWDGSAGSLQVLYKLKTAKLFEKPRTKQTDSSGDDPFAIHLISLCPESRKLCIAGASSHVILFKFRKTESGTDTVVLEIPILYELTEGSENSPEFEYPGNAVSSRTDISDCDAKKGNCTLKVKPGVQKKAPGFQAQLVCLTPCSNGDPPGPITSLSINSLYGLMAYGNESGLVIVDILQKICLMNIGSPDLYGSQDPYSRALRSPKRTQAGSDTAVLSDKDDRQVQSPSIDQINGVCYSAAPGATGGQGVHACAASSSTGGQGLPRARPDPVRRSRSQDKLDSSFSRSRSSSMSSLENITSETIQCLAFTDSYAKKSEPLSLVPTLWVGTSLGSVITILVTLPENDSRSSQPVVVSLAGVTIFRLKGAILTMSFLDCNGALIPYTYEAWKDENKDRKDRTPTRAKSSTLVENQSKGDLFGDRQFVVIASEKQARIIALPSQNCIYRQQIADSDFVVKAETISMKESVCLVCYVSNGHLMAYSLPSLRLLLDVDFLPLSEQSFQTQIKKGIVDPMLSIWGQQLIVNEDTDQIARTFCFSNRGHGLYLCSPSELQKFTLCSEFCAALSDMTGELFLAIDMPEAPKAGFLKSLLGGGVAALDREELFGSTSGKGSKSVAKHIPGSLQETSQRASTAASEISRAHMLAMERGDKLNQLEERTQRMMNESEQFASASHSLMLKYKDKKWYQL